MFSGASTPSVGVISAIKTVRAQREMDPDFVAASSFDGSMYDSTYFLKGALAGGICCSITHGALTPVDVVKTRIQLDPVKYNQGLIGGFRQVAAEEGTGALLTGLGATFVGYFIQGMRTFAQCQRASFRPCSSGGGPSYPNEGERPWREIGREVQGRYGRQGEEGGVWSLPTEALNAPM